MLRRFVLVLGLIWVCGASAAAQEAFELELFTKENDRREQLLRVEEASRKAPESLQRIYEECLSSPLPSTPTNVLQTITVTWFSDEYRLDIWRHACSATDSAVLIRMTPETPSVFFCGANFILVQGGLPYIVTLLDDPASFLGVCNYFTDPTTVILTNGSAARTFDDDAAFTLVIDSPSGQQQLAISSFPEGQPPPPAGGVATYSFQTSTLSIPVVEIPGVGYFQLNLSLIPGTSPLQFIYQSHVQLQ
jgi:hypothetical protein